MTIGRVSQLDGITWIFSLEGDIQLRVKWKTLLRLSLSVKFGNNQQIRIV